MTNNVTGTHHVSTRVIIDKTKFYNLMNQTSYRKMMTDNNGDVSSVRYMTPKEVIDKVKEYFEDCIVEKLDWKGKS